MLCTCFYTEIGFQIVVLAVCGPSNSCVTQLFERRKRAILKVAMSRTKSAKNKRDHHEVRHVKRAAKENGQKYEDGAESDGSHVPKSAQKAWGPRAPAKKTNICKTKICHLIETL